MMTLLPIYLYSIYSTPTFRSMNSPRPVHVKMYVYLYFGTYANNRPCD